MSDGKLVKTPMFEAINAARYERQRLFRKIHELTGVSLVSYVGGPTSGIDRSDGAYFHDLVYLHTPETPLDVMIHTPGGDIDAAEKIMSILRLRVGGGRLRAVVPDYAKSAGTMMAISADAIVMGDTSELGPIDPQLSMNDDHGNKVTWSVQAYVDQYEDLRGRLEANPDDAAARVMFEKLDSVQYAHFKGCASALACSRRLLYNVVCAERAETTHVSPIAY